MIKRKTLGILGGLGPLASARFYSLVTSHTYAERDQDHLDVVLVSGATTPDRTEFITGKSPVSPLSEMKHGIMRLERAGAELIAIPCNTAHVFYRTLSECVSVPVIDIIESTVSNAVSSGARTAGILATTGTLVSDSYQRVCRKHGLEYILPDEDGQNMLMSLIYNCIKRSKLPDPSEFFTLSEKLVGMGCDTVIIGCTELSLIPVAESGIPFTDSLLVLAYEAITGCGGVPKDFPDTYTRK